MDKYRSWRWVILCLGIAANLSLGISYSGSVISKPVLLKVGVANQLVELESRLADLESQKAEIPDPLKEGIASQRAELKTHWGLVFSLGIAFLPMGMIIAGWLADKKGPRFPIGLGAVIFVSGVILASFATSYAFLCFTLGFMISLGCGLAYGPLVASAVRWFPDRRGLASGLVVGALGFGPVWIAPFSSIMLDSYHFEITTVLRCLGIIALIAMGAATVFITSPPADFQVALKHGATAKSQKAAQKPAAINASRDVAWKKMIVTTDFWVLFFLFVLGTMPGLMFISQAKTIFESLGGFTPVKAALLVAVLGAANATGRVLWGAISDYLGRINTLLVMFVCSAIAMFALPFATQPALLVAVILVIGTTFGGYLGLFPSFCADSFGLKNMSLNYAILFIAFGVSALISPQIYSMMKSQDTAFTIAAVLSLAGLLGTLGKMLLTAKNRTA